MSEEKGRTKWASEIYDTLLIFRRISNQVYGLLLVELGWVLLLVLVAKLSPSGGNNPQPAIVAVPLSGPLKVTDLVIPGAIVLACFWIIWSRIITYVWLLVRCAFRRATVLLVDLVGFCFGLLNVFLLPITYPLELIRARRWIERLGKDAEEKLRKELADKAKDRLQRLIERQDMGTAAGIYGFRIAWLAFKGHEHDCHQLDKLHSVIGNRELRRHAVNATKTSRWIVFTNFIVPLRRINTWLASRAYIAFAPLQSFNYEEDLNSSKAPAQVFAAASDRIQWQLQNVKLMRHISFNFLPQHWVPKNSSEAGLLRWFFGLNTLLWGSYLPEPPTRICLNIKQHPRRGEKEDKERMLRPMEDPFPLVFRTQYSTMVVDQQEALDAYIVLVVAILQTLQTRQSPSKKVLIRVLSGQLWDELQYSYSEVRQLIEHLVFDAFPLLSESHSTAHDAYPSPRRILVEIVGQWIGHTLKRAESDSDAYAMVKDYPATLRQMLKRCIELDPRISENYYRLAALNGLMGRPDEAVRSADQAKRYEVIRDADASYFISAMADLTLRLSGSSSQEISLAMFAAYAARAINIGTGRTKESLRENLEASDQYKLHRLLAEIPDSKPDEISESLWKVIEHLLSDRYQSGPAT